MDIRNDSDVVGVCRGIIMSINKTKDVTWRAKICNDAPRTNDEREDSFCVCSFECVYGDIPVKCNDA